MRKMYAVFLLLSAFVITTTSCKKGFTCECIDGGRIVSSTIITDLGKGGAKNVCDSYQVQNNMHGARQVCTLK
jgi:hypothetical protein